ncbi:hypothetical protein HYPSUDRAFT_585966 [Hypholoma sublateritium FD-334 SS-4]|uniref:Uncharacterized protein n=1 Tax=Hypholoma sublateritium (strain FD-334 SS-4) TaxID=945553 RepID=A0A0D2PUX2_HYPSF|nr:hypothetical protein HYPSUDRAFT_585966 [Hypholoma sublateritium FD-334 SS-4]
MFPSHSVSAPALAPHVQAAHLSSIASPSPADTARCAHSTRWLRSTPRARTPSPVKTCFLSATAGPLPFTPPPARSPYLLVCTAATGTTVHRTSLIHRQPHTARRAGTCLYCSRGCIFFCAAHPRSGVHYITAQRSRSGPHAACMTHPPRARCVPVSFACIPPPSHLYAEWSARSSRSQTS